jgi:DNA-binding MarR family transcriptional regulator
MNRYVMAWAWDQRVSPTQKLVLLALAQHASETYDCWPGEERLMELTGLPLHAVSKAVCDLETMGLILCLRLKLIREKILPNTHS